MIDYIADQDGKQHLNAGFIRIDPWISIEIQTQLQTLSVSLYNRTDGRLMTRFWITQYFEGLSRLRINHKRVINYKPDSMQNVTVNLNVCVFTKLKKPLKNIFRLTFQLKINRINDICIKVSSVH